MPPPRQKPTETMTEYRLSMVESAVEKIGSALVGIERSLSALATLEARHTGIEESVSRNFKRLEAVEAKQDLLDDEFKKWFNRGMGIASVVSILFMAGGGMIYSQLSEIAGAAKKVERLQADMERQKAFSRMLAKKAGIDIDYVPE